MTDFRSPDRSSLRWNGDAIAAAAGLGLGLAAVLAAGRIHPAAAARRDDGDLGVLSVFLVLFVLPAAWIVIASALTALASGGLRIALEELPARLRAYETFRLGVRLTNLQPLIPNLFASVTARWEAPSGALETPPAFIGAILPGRTASVSWRVVARQRGWLTLSRLRVAIQFPGSLFTRVHVVDPAVRMRVLPLVYRLDRSLLSEISGRIHSAAGRTHATPAAWEEFVGVRPYRPGDNPRSVHLPLSVRMAGFPADLVVREFEDPSQEDVWVALEPGIEGESPDAFAFDYERAISFAASVCRMLVRNGLRIRFITTSADRAVTLEAGERRTDLHRVETVLSELRPSEQHKLFRELLSRASRESRERTVFLIGVGGTAAAGTLLSPRQQERLIQEVLLP